MKKILVCVLALLLLTGCSKNYSKLYNDEVVRYDKLVSEEYPKKYDKSKDKDKFYGDVANFDKKVKRLEDKILKDKKISKEEYEEMKDAVDGMEDLINEK